MRNTNKDPQKLLISFSILTNGEKLFGVKRSNSKSSINCLNGLRAISVLWIMFGHRLGNQQTFPLTNVNVTRQHFNHYYSSVLTAYDKAVDTFFVMGALLATTSTLKALTEGKFSIPRTILHRYLRYTPAYAALILYIVSLSKYVTNGPIQRPELRQNCIHYWWSSLLHIQNYINPNQLCADHAWYLSADFQLFITTPLMLYPVWRWGRKYLWGLMALTITSSIYVLFMSFSRSFFVLTRSSEVGEDFSKLIYFATHSRMGPWIIGIILGYVIYFYDNSRKFSKRVNFVLWITSISIMASVIILSQPFNQPDNNPTSLLWNAIYLSFHRPLWAIGISWIIFACQKLKTGGVIRWFLCLTFWQPIARMSLSIYLVHLVYQLTTMANQKTVMTFEIWTIVSFFCSEIDL